MKKILFLALAAGSFSFTSCDSKKEDAAEAKGDAVEASADAKAAGMEASADSTKKAGENTAGAMKDNADKMAAPATGTTTTEVKK